MFFFYLLLLNRYNYFGVENLLNDLHEMGSDFQMSPAVELSEVMLCFLFNFSMRCLDRKKRRNGHWVVIY